MNDLHLNPKVFDGTPLADIEQIYIRKGFGEGLLKAGERDSSVVGLCADLTESTQMLAFKQKFPERFVEMGVAEQNLASVASGMAASGKLPFITSYAMFSPGRNWEQIRTTICYNDRKVIIAGSHAGVSVGPDGGTHQALEDIAITRVIPNIVVIVPCDTIEARKATLAVALAAKDGGTDAPVYLRLAREKSPVITTEDTPFEIGKAQIFFEPKIQSKDADSGKPNAIPYDLGIVASGALVYKAIKAAQALEKEGIAVKVLNLATIKPIDVDALVKLSDETGALVTVEEHQVHGGVGSAVVECLAANASRPPVVEFVGAQDRFGQSGLPEEVIEHYGMGEGHIIEAAKKALGRKNA